MLCRAFEAVRRIAEGRKLHSGYQFVVLDDPDLVYGMTGSSDMEFPSLFVWEKKTGHYYLYNVRTKHSTVNTCRILNIESFIFVVLRMCLYLS